MDAAERCIELEVGQRLTFYPDKTDAHLHFPAVVESITAEVVTVRVFSSEDPKGQVRKVARERLIDQLELDGI